MGSFNPNIPLITDPTLLSYAQIRANFQDIDAAFADNHFGLTKDPDFAGMHNVLTCRPQGPNIPGGLDPTTTAAQTALYNKLVTNGSSAAPNLFFRPNSNQTPIQLTYPSIKADSSNTQYTFVAGPFIIYGGFLKAPTSGITITLTPGTKLLYVDLTAANAMAKTPDFIIPATPTATNITGNSFTLNFLASVHPPSSLDVYYFAIGM